MARTVTLDQIGTGHHVELTFNNGDTYSGIVEKVNRTSLVVEGERIAGTRIDSAKISGRVDPEDNGRRIDVAAVNKAKKKIKARASGSDDGSTTTRKKRGRKAKANGTGPRIQRRPVAGAPGPDVEGTPPLLAVLAVREKLLEAIHAIDTFNISNARDCVNVAAETLGEIDTSEDAAE